jgi:uncharacterized protein YbjT (DUF2867 family)
MRLTVFGATGEIGTQVVKQALAGDRDVTAVVRDPARLAAPPAAIKPALDGADAAASAQAQGAAAPRNPHGQHARHPERPDGPGSDLYRVNLGY